MSQEDDQVPWSRLVDWARTEVRSTLSRLPQALRDAAGRLPVTYERVPGADLLQDGIEPDTLGLFVGSSFSEEPVASMPVPAQIILFLENLWDVSEGDSEIFREEVGTTYLHELGHYLGLDEDELFDRGLE